MFRVVSSHQPHSGYRDIYSSESLTPGEPVTLRDLYTLKKVNLCDTEQKILYIRVKFPVCPKYKSKILMSTR